ncbi:DNA-processing protein DprA [Desulfotomaculum nigrificans]|uniref:DNA-processing protein DprA n=1 Tax=Desulfotomaculum nigrificans TaxID=1565 RepID=UPI0001FAEEE5|nr:DNA-processing protein DprA [Desulfotomaculum nigrificans]
MDKRQLWIYWQILFPGAGPRIWQLIKYFGSVEQAWQAGESDLGAIPWLGPKGAQKLVRRRESIQFDRVINYLNDIGCSVITIEDDDYPTLLKDIYDPPPALFVRGKLPNHERTAVAVVGSRKPSPYGLAAAEDIATELARSDIVIISGMARGIDTAAHRGALKGKGTTVAVLGCGPDVVYPKENARLMDKIIEQGAVISEFPPGMAPLAWHFPARNRIISGLSQAVLVVEAAEKSGALITADFALEQGRDVLAIPGNITSPNSVGTNKLIRQGARLVTKAEDILEELGLGTLYLNQISSSPDFNFTAGERDLWEVLSYQPMSLEQLVEASKLSPQDTAAAITMLEIKGLVRLLPGKVYVKAKL